MSRSLLFRFHMLGEESIIDSSRLHITGCGPILSSNSNCIDLGEVPLLVLGTKTLDIQNTSPIFAQITACFVSLYYLLYSYLIVFSNEEKCNLQTIELRSITKRDRRLRPDQRKVDWIGLFNPIHFQPKYLVGSFSSFLLAVSRRNQASSGL